MNRLPPTARLPSRSRRVLAWGGAAAVLAFSAFFWLADGGMNKKGASMRDTMPSSPTQVSKPTEAPPEPLRKPLRPEATTAADSLRPSRVPAPSSSESSPAPGPQRPPAGSPIVPVRTEDEAPTQPGGLTSDQASPRQKLSFYLSLYRDLGLGEITRTLSEAEMSAIDSALEDLSALKEKTLRGLISEYRLKCPPEKLSSALDGVGRYMGALSRSLYAQHPTYSSAQHEAAYPFSESNIDKTLSGANAHARAVNGALAPLGLQDLGVPFKHSFCALAGNYNSRVFERVSLIKLTYDGLALRSR